MALEFAAGFFGGCAGVAVGHPLDTIKVRLQTQDSRNPLYRGTWHCFRETIKKESVRGLYKGMSSPMAGVAVINAIVFGVQGNVVKYAPDPKSLSSHCMAGAAAGFVQSFICSPMELIKTQVQVNNKYKSPIDCLKKIFKTKGLKGIFRGQGITVAREIPAFTCYFGTFELASQSLYPYMNDNMAILLSGGLAGVTSWALTYPIDVVKSRLQADSSGKYRNSLDCMRSSINAEGWRVLTRGINSTIIRAFPTNAATFCVAKFTMSLYTLSENYENELIYNEIIQNGHISINQREMPAYIQTSKSIYQDHICDCKKMLENIHVEVLERILYASLEKTQESQECKPSLLRIISGCSCSLAYYKDYLLGCCFETLTARHQILSTAL